MVDIRHLAEQMKKPQEMSISELKEWIYWADQEILEYVKFANELKAELRKREE